MWSPSPAAFLATYTQGSPRYVKISPAGKRSNDSVSTVCARHFPVSITTRDDMTTVVVVVGVVFFLCRGWRREGMFAAVQFEKAFHHHSQSILVASRRSPTAGPSLGLVSAPAPAPAQASQYS